MPRIVESKLLKADANRVKAHVEPLTPSFNGAKLHWQKSNLPNNSGHILFFKCPICDRKCRYLYEFIGYWRCRQCFNLTYQRNNINTNCELGRLRRRLNQLANELKQPQLGFLDTKLPPKPEGMKYERYFELIREFQRVTDDYAIYRKLKWLISLRGLVTCDLRELRDLLVL